MTESAPQHFPIQTRFLYGDAFFAIAGLVMISATWIPTGISYVLFGSAAASLLRASLLINAAFIAFLLLFFMIKHELHLIQYILVDNCIVRTSPFGATTVGLPNVVRFAYVKIPLLRGYMVISSNEHTIRIPFIVEHMSVLIKNLKAVLDSCGRTSAYDIQQIDSALQHAIQFDCAHERAKKMLRPLVVATCLFVCFNAIIASRIWLMTFPFVALWCLVTLALPIAAYSLGEYISSGKSKAREESISEPCLFHWSDTGHLQAIMIIFIIYLIAGITFQLLPL